jgi:hypothetical protein
MSETIHITAVGVSEESTDEQGNPRRWARGISDKFKDTESGLPVETFISFTGDVPTEVGTIQVTMLAVSNRPATYDSDGVMTRPESKSLVVVNNS